MLKLKPIHPREMLQEEFLRPLGLRQYRLALDINVPPRRINEIVHGKRGITVGTALRLAHYFNVSPEFWMNLQTCFDLLTKQENLGSEIQKLKSLKAA